MSKVLVVEDNNLNLRLFDDLLTMKGHKVIISKDGIGLEKLVAEENPDLILMDIQLNGLSGLELIKDLKQNNASRHIPIIAITAFAMQNDEKRIMESGCDMYLTKPVSIDGFFFAIEKFIGPNKK